MRLDQQQDACRFWLNLKELYPWSFLDVYVQRETEGANYLIDFTFRRTLIILTKQLSRRCCQLLPSIGVESELASFKFTAVWHRRATSLELTVRYFSSWVVSYKLFLACTSTGSLSDQFYQVSNANVTHCNP